MDQDTKALLDKNVLPINGEVGIKMFEMLKECFLYFVMKGSPDITMLICSNGGSVEDGLNIYDLIKMYRGKITGQVVSSAYSMAAILLQACDKRVCAPHAKVLIHYISRRNLSLDKLKNPDELKKIIEDMSASQDCLEEILQKRTGKSLEEIQKKCLEDEPMNAKEALEFGLIDEIIDFDKAT